MSETLVMCGRFSQDVPVKDLASLLGFDLDELMDPKHSLAPTQTVAVVRAAPATGRPELARLRWGLIPSWAKEVSIGNKLFNARAETVTEKPSFRNAFKQRRCLIPASGYYEWKREGKHKQPYYIGMRDRAPFAMAGLWESWQPAEGGCVESCTILTIGPNELLQSIHDRMPVILEPATFSAWLKPGAEHLESLKTLLVPFPADRMAAEPVDLNPAAKLASGQEQQLLF